MMTNVGVLEMLSSHFFGISVGLALCIPRKRLNLKEAQGVKRILGSSPTLSYLNGKLLVDI